MKIRAGLVVLLVLFVVQVTEAKTYVALSIDQYHRFEPFERFMQYIPTLGVGWEGENTGVEFNFNLYEAIDGPTSVHTYTPWTIESYRQTENYRFEANALVFVDVYDDNDPYRETMLEAKARAAYPVGPLTLHVVPVVRAYDQDGGRMELGLGGGLSWRRLTLGVNMLDTKDYYMLGREKNVFTAQAAVPMSNGNYFTVEWGKILGKQGRESMFFVYRFDLVNLIEF